MKSWFILHTSNFQRTLRALGHTLVFIWTVISFKIGLQYYLNLYNDPGIMRYLYFCVFSWNRDKLDQFLLTESSIMLFVCIFLLQDIFTLKQLLTVSICLYSKSFAYLCYKFELLWISLHHPYDVGLRTQFSYIIARGCGWAGPSNYL